MSMRSDTARYEGIINGLRVNELQTLLIQFNHPKIGKKQELIQRCLHLLLNPNSQAKTIKLIEEMNRRVARPAPYTTPAVGNRVANNFSQQMSYQHNMRYPNGGATMHVAQQQVVQQAPVARQIRGLKPIVLPFYDYLSTIQEPIELPAVASGLKSPQKQIFTFGLNDEDCKLFKFKSEELPRTELQLRFFLLQGDWQNQVVSDDFPLNCQVRIDDSIVTLPSVIPTNKPNVEPKRPSRPVNITTYCFPPRDRTRPHRVVIDWTGDRRVWCCAVYKVRRITANILLTRAERNESSRYASELTKQTIINRLGMNDEDGICMDQIKISLLCPLGKTRMELPCRGRKCTHLQCFDLKLYLQMNEKRPTWKCAVCSEIVSYDSIIIDQYFMNMLNDVPKDVTEVELKKDGGYAIIKEDVLDLSDDDDEKPITTTAAAVRPTTSTSSAATKKVSQDDDIITLDSDDEDDLQRAVEASKKDKPPPRSPHSDHSDSIIIIDVDTPPRPQQQIARVAPQINQQSSSASPTPPSPITPGFIPTYMPSSQMPMLPGYNQPPTTSSSIFANNGWPSNQQMTQNGYMAFQQHQQHQQQQHQQQHQQQQQNHRNMLARQYSQPQQSYNFMQPDLYANAPTIRPTQQMNLDQMIQNLQAQPNFAPDYRTGQ